MSVSDTMRRDSASSATRRDKVSCNAPSYMWRFAFTKLIADTTYSSMLLPLLNWKMGVQMEKDEKMSHCWYFNSIL
jgi:hypothetical protein